MRGSLRVPTFAFAVFVAALGGATATDARMPTAGPPAASDAGAPVGTPGTSLAVGRSHSCAIAPDRTVRCWGRNNAGQIGDGTTTSRPLPTVVLAGEGSGAALSGATAVAVGADFSCALLTTTTVACWGDNLFGQLGDGTNENRSDPVAVQEASGSGLALTGVVSISAGADHACAVLGDGTARCWGDNRAGSLGSGETRVGRETVVVVDDAGSTAPLAGIDSIAAGGDHTCAVLENGTVKCWGRNTYGQLGNDDRTTRSGPVAVKLVAGSTSLLSGVTAVSTGTFHSCALHDDGTISCWGSNQSGEIGDGTEETRYAPVRVVAAAGSTTPFTGARQISLGQDHTCAGLESGGAACWGYSFRGGLGIGTPTSVSAPAVVVATAGGDTALGDVTLIAAGGSHTCATFADGSVRCWGQNTFGQLGDDTFQDRSTPIVVVGLAVARTPSVAKEPVPFRDSIATPSEISLDPLIVAQSVIIATGVIVFVPFPGILFNSTLEAHYAEISSRARAARRRLASLFSRLWRWVRARTGKGADLVAAADEAIDPEGDVQHDPWRTPRGIVLFVLATALLGSLLDPTFGPDLRSVAVFLGVALGLVVILVASNVPRAIAYRWSGVQFVVRALPGTLIVGLVCVLISRWTAFQPGYLYGLIVGVAAARNLGHVREGRTTAVATVVLLVTAIAAWLGLWWLPDLTQPGAEPPLLVIGLQTAFATMVVAGFEGAAIGSLPLRYLPGDTIRRWNQRVWVVLGVLSVGGFLHILVNPASGYLADSTRTPMLTIVALLVGFGLVSVAFWGYFRYRRPPLRPRPAAPS